MNKERLKYCRYYTGDNSFETDKKVPFDKMYMMYAEKYYVNGSLYLFFFFTPTLTTLK